MSLDTTIDAPPSCADTATPSTKSAGEPVSERMRRAGLYEVRRDFNRFMYGNWVKLEPIEVPPLGMGPLLPDRHSPSCLCAECVTAGQHYSDYVKARRLQNDGI